MNPLAAADDLVTLVRGAADQWGEREAWVFDATGERLTFADIDRRSSGLAATLAGLGVGSGDRVTVMLRNQPEFPLLWLALAKLGAALVPVNTGYREFDGAHVIRHSGARLAVVAKEFADLLARITPETALRQVVTVEELTETPATQKFRAVGEQTANIQYTSGTTGAPKGCVLPHRYWTTIARSMVTNDPALTEHDITLTAQPFHYVDPQWTVATGLMSGTKVVVLDRFHPSSFLSKVREHQVTWFYCLGLMPTLLLRNPPSPEDTRHRLRSISASAIPHDLHAELERRWGVPWFEAFGMTETGADLRVRQEDHDETVGTGCIGTPVPGRDVLIADAEGRPAPRGTTGELVIRGVGLMHGYLDDPAATANAFRGGWFHTGDLARMDDAGRVYYVGRTKDMIRRSGENVSADEVERALMLHPDVRLAAVVAVPDELRGEEVKAFVVLRDGLGPADVPPDTLAAFGRDKLAYFKVPRYWTYRESLPLTPSERVAKGQLRAEADPLAGSYDVVEARWR